MPLEQAYFSHYMKNVFIYNKHNMTYATMNLVHPQKGVAILVNAQIWIANSTFRWQ